jgi:hypothetical protein
MSNILNYNLFKKLNVSNVKSLNEGISFSCEHIEGSDSNNMNVNWDSDSDLDVVKLANPRKTVPSNLSSIRTYAGYVLEDVKLEGEPGRHSVKKCFSEYVKNWGSLSQDDLKKLISRTYPEDLKNRKVKVLFVMGSSAPLSANMAEALKELYYPDAKIIDIMKAYYGIDPDDIVDWDKYEQADARTQSMIRTFVNSFKSTYDEDGNRIPPQRDFTGYIKKSSGLQSGARSILNPGHMIDEYIIKSITSEMEEWNSQYSNQDFRIKQANMPSFLVLDDLIIQGSTMRGAMSNVLSAISSNKSGISKSLSEIAKTNIFGYVLFTYGTRFR